MIRLKRCRWQIKSFYWMQGSVVQIGSPQEFYEKPANEFVAKFIGTPPMNVIYLNDISEQELKDIPLPKGFQSTGSIGIRPEHLFISETGLAVEIASIEYLGGESVVRLNHSDKEISMRLTNQPNLKRGDKLFISWKEENVHLFDGEQQRL